MTLFKKLYLPNLMHFTNTPLHQSQLKIPALQRVANCVACGGAASLFCGGCGITPYCSAGCQRRDYTERHRQVCHNLKRSASGGASAPKAEHQPEPLLPATPALRRPRSPDPVKCERRDDDFGSERAPQHKFGPPGAVATSHTVNDSRTNVNSRAAAARSNQTHDRARPNQGDDRARPNQGDDRARPNQGDDRARPNQGDDRARPNQGDDRARPNQGNRGYQDDRNGRQNRPDDARSGGRNGQDGRGNDRNDNRRQNSNGERRSRLSDRLNNRPADPQPDEEWGAKPEPKAEEPQPAPKPKSPSVQLVEPKLQHKVVVPPKAAVTTPEAKTVKVTPDVVGSSRKLVPEDCLTDLLSVNDSFTLSVDASAASCRAGAGAGAGFVCLALHENYSDKYMQLLDDSFTARCEASPPCSPRPGDTFVYLNPDDGGWYRARCVGAASAALLDGSKLVALAAADRCHALPPDYRQLPEYCCRLEAGNVQISDKLNATVVSKTGNTLTVSLVNLETGAAQGTGTVQRWTPTVDYPKPTPTPAPAPTPSEPAPKAPASAAAAAAASIPEVPRPPLAERARVLLVDATAPERVFVRSAHIDNQKEFDDVVMEVAVYGVSATPLTEPPVKGQTVVAKFTDGNHYRALCKRVNSKLNKYLLEYIEYGNTAVAFLEDLYPCPPELDLPRRPTLASQAALQMTQKSFTDAATQYLDRLKDDSVELILCIPSGSPTAASGSAVRLTVAQSGEDVNRAVDALCTPEWQRLMERGGDVMDVTAPLFSDITYVDLPAAGCELEVSDTSLLQGGVLAGHERGAPHAARSFALADRLAEYCSSALCKDPYLPKEEELCVALCPIRKQWLRGAFLQQSAGAGGSAAEVMFFDYGNVETLPVSQLRKMMPEFVRHLPAAACSLEIRDFPKNPTEEQLDLAKQYMKINEQGSGTLRLTRCQKQDPGEYIVDAPELIRAMKL